MRGDVRQGRPQLRSISQLGWEAEDAESVLPTIIPRRHRSDLLKDIHRRARRGKIRFPAALPFIISGSKVAIALAVIGAVIGEFIGSNEGLENLMLVTNSQINIPLAFAALFGLALIGILLYSAVVAVEWALRPWFGEIAH
jgi:ABC-type antimicrobial peptide transport system permease subunit